MTVRAVALRAIHLARVTPERRGSVVVVLSTNGTTRVLARDPYMRTIRRRDASAAWLLEREGTLALPDEVLVIRWSDLGPEVLRVKVAAEGDESP